MRAYRCHHAYRVCTRSRFHVISTPRSPTDRHLPAVNVGLPVPVTLRLPARPLPAAFAAFVHCLPPALPTLWTRTCSLCPHARRLPGWCVPATFPPAVPATATAALPTCCGYTPPACLLLVDSVADGRLGSPFSPCWCPAPPPFPTATCCAIPGGYYLPHAHACSCRFPTPVVLLLLPCLPPLPGTLRAWTNCPPVPPCHTTACFLRSVLLVGRFSHATLPFLRRGRTAGARAAWT